MDAIKDLISTLGFPIACCIAMFWQNEKMRLSLDNNTKAIQEITIRLKGDIDD